MSILPGLASSIGFGAAGDPTTRYVGTAVDTVNRTIYTFSDQDIGTAKVNRMVVVGAFGNRLTGTPSQITSITVGGNTATNAASRTNDAVIVNLRHVAMDANDTADIVVTFGQDQKQCTIVVFAVYGLASHTKESAGFDDANKPLTGTLTTTVGATTIALATCSATSRTWTSSGDGQLAEVFDAAMEAQSGGAFLSLSAEDTSMDINITYSGTNVFEAGVWSTWN